MIRCHRSQLENRCRQRGYKLADVMGCVVEQDGDRWLIDVDHPAYPRPRADDWKPVPIGDLVERGLTAIGITKARVERLTRTKGKPGGCGCGARQRWLNEVGFKAQYAIRDGYKAVERFYLGEN
jgi:hypothetical protein